MQKNYPFDPQRDYVPIAMVAEWSAILVVKKDLPVNTLAEFVAYAKARPGALNWGTTGFGSFAHLVGEVFMQQTGISMQHVQYKGGSQATTDLIAGAIDAHMMSSAVGAGQAANPRLKMLAVASRRRLHSLPKVPTMAEAGVHGVDQTAWLCLFGPPGLPQAVRERLAREIVAIAHDPAYVMKLRNTGFEPLGLDAAASERDVPRRGRALVDVHQVARAGGEGQVVFAGDRFTGAPQGLRCRPRGGGDPVTTALSRELGRQDARMWGELSAAKPTR